MVAVNGVTKDLKASFRRTCSEHCWDECKQNERDNR